MTLILSAAAVSNRGLVRSNNEDAAHAGRRLVAVADGMGGLPSGELASEIAIRALAKLDGGTDPEGPLASLRAAADAANEEIRRFTKSNPASDGMGTTLTALLLSADRAEEPRMGLLHVGDSRCYLRREGHTSRLTRDDTFVQSLVDEGALTAEEARKHPRRSIVTRAVDGHRLMATYELLAPRPGDRYLICSDGLSDVVDDETIGRALGSYPNPSRCAEQLVRLALDAGAPDNVTVVVADVCAG